MKVFILAAGLGSRIRAVHPHVPKSLIPVLGKPFIQWQIEYLRDQGFRDFVICVGYLKEKIVEVCGDGSSWGVAIAYSEEEEPRGTGTTLKHARSFFNSSSVVLNGDTYLPIDYRSFFEEHVRHSAEKISGTIALSTVENDGSRGTVVCTPDGRVASFVEKDNAVKGPRLVNAGAYVLEPSVLDQLPEGPASLERDLFPRLALEGTLRGVQVPSTFIDMGTPEGLRSLEAFLA